MDKAQDSPATAVLPPGRRGSVSVANAATDLWAGGTVWAGSGSRPSASAPGAAFSGLDGKRIAALSRGIMQDGTGAG